MPKQLLVVLLAAVMLSTAIGFAFGRASEPSPAQAAGSSQTVNQLKAVNRQLRDIKQSTFTTCQGVKVYPYTTC